MKAYLLILVLLSMVFYSCAQNKGNAKSITEGRFEFDEVVNDWTTPIKKSNEEWKKILTPEQYHILREAGTERPYTREFNHIKEEGLFVCAACNNGLFSSKAKFDSGTGWPSFYRPLDKKSLTEKTDYKIGYARTEINCQRCDSHLGHVFNDGPRETTGLRYCMNGIALEFTPKN